MKIIFAMLLFMLVGCHRKENAIYVIENDGSPIEISIQRTSSHPALAEFDRILKMRIGGVEKADFKMLQDTGGMVRVNAYFDFRTKWLLLRDRAGCFLIDTANASVTENCPMEIMGWNYLGAFDAEPGRSWKFFLASERVEKEVSNN